MGIVIPVSRTLARFNSDGADGGQAGARFPQVPTQRRDGLRDRNKSLGLPEGLSVSCSGAAVVLGFLGKERAPP